MPRQPLLYVRPKAKYRFPANALSERPRLAPLIGQCIAFWSQAEAQLAVLLSAIMKTDTAIASAVFLSIRNSRAQREALGAAAQIGLTGRELEMFSAIELVYQSLDAQRTDLAHGIFGVSDEMPDALLWAEAKDYIKFSIEHWIEISNQTGILPLSPPQRSDEKFKTAISVYRAPDLIGLRDEIKEFWEAVFRFSTHLRLVSVFPGVKKEAEFQRLYDMPTIQRALARLRARPE
jgi:hypothetical protein